MRVRLLLVLALVAAVAGCRGTDSPRSSVARPGSADPWATPADPWATGSASARGTSDPWAVSPDLDEPPGLAERQRLANSACPRVTAPYFYRIERAGKVSHILGTRHIGVPLSKFPPAVHHAVASAKLAVFEVAPGDDSDDAEVPISIKDALGPALWRRYQLLAGPDLARSLEHTTPSAALLALVAMHEDITAMLDLEIQREVEKAGIPTRGLETSAFQDELLEKLLDIRMLRASLEHTESRDEIAKESREDLTEYCAGTDDEPGMDADMRADLLASGYTKAEIARIDEDLVFTRNADWIPKLAPILDAGGAFIAVGADHLSGPRGVIALLVARGYTATRIK